MKKTQQKRKPEIEDKNKKQGKNKTKSQKNR